MLRRNHILQPHRSSGFTRSTGQQVALRGPHSCDWSTITVHEFGEFLYPSGRYPVAFADSYGVFYEAPGGIQSLATGQRMRGGFYSSYLDPANIEAYDGGPDAPMRMHGCVPWANYHLEH